MEEIRSALIIASDEYTDPGLRRLRAPASDARALEAVLGDSEIGGFEVRTLLNKPAHVINLAVEEFFADRRPSDLLLVHYSGHGIKDEDGELYFAASDTVLGRLAATAVAGEFVSKRMNRGRSRRVVLLLDCCYAGAFEQGMTARAGTDMGIEQQLGGRGRAVITASSAMEYAFEAGELADPSEVPPSVFTSALVQGLETGDADRDQDGLVGLDELYDYVYDKVRAATPNQTPRKSILGMEGKLYIARRSRPVTTPATLPLELQQAIDSPLTGIRVAGVQELARVLHGRHAGMALAARLALEQLTGDDSRAVAAAAGAALGDQLLPLQPAAEAAATTRHEPAPEPPPDIGQWEPKFLNFDVAIESLNDHFRARLIASPAGEAYADFALPFTDQQLEIFVLKVAASIGRPQRKVRRLKSEERRLIEDFGGQLFRAVFSGPVRACLERSRLEADDGNAGLRIRLQLPGALANIPWEYLYDPEYGFLGLSPATTLVRYEEMPHPVRPFRISPPLRILTMMPAPTDFPEIDGELEWGKLIHALADLISGGQVEVDRLEAGTLAALQRSLRLREYHVLHFSGHGGYDENAQNGALVLEAADGKSRLVTGRDLGVMLCGHSSLRLVVVNACEGARSARDDPYGGVAQALVRQGIPAVVAMQFEISDAAALVFSQSFYQAIAEALPVDVATLEARRAMFAEGNEVEWATPVLYLRSPDGRVFHWDRTSGAGRQV